MEKALIYPSTTNPRFSSQTNIIRTTSISPLIPLNSVFIVWFFKLFKQILGGSLNNTNFTYSDTVTKVYFSWNCTTVFKLANKNLKKLLDTFVLNVVVHTY